MIIHQKLDSSSLEAKRIIKVGNARDGLIIWVKNQTDGHGRYGRSWQNSGEGNLTFSFIIENKRSIAAISAYPFIVAVAVRDALKPFLNTKQLAQISFKWPNDILFKGKKIAGILLESEIRGDVISYVICGIGINIASSPSNLDFATSIDKEGIKNINLEVLIKNIVANFDQYLNLANSSGDQVIYDLWLKNAHNLGQEIIILTGTEEVKGIFCGIKDGNLIVKQNGNNRAFFTGDVFFSENEIITTKNLS